MKKKIILIYLFFISLNSFSQQQDIDSLRAVVQKTKVDTIKINTLNKLSSLYYYKDIRKSLEFSKTAYSLSKKINYTKGIASSYNNIGVYYWIKSNFPKALDYNLKALHLFENLNDKKGIANTNNGLGTIYAEFKNYKQALYCYNRALKISKEINDRKSIATFLNNIGDVYLRMKVYQKALLYFDKAIKTNPYEKSNYESGLNYTNIGITLNFLGQYQKSMEACNKSIAIYKNDSSLFNAYNKIELGKSHYYLALKEKASINHKQHLQKSLDYINEALVIFRREESLIDIRDSYYYLSKIYKSQQQSELALEYFEKSSKINDSIFSNENKIQVEFLKSQREIDIRDKKIEIQNLKIKNEARKVYLLYTITIAILILLGLFFWLYLSKRKTNFQLEEKNKIISDINKQKDKFFSIIAHDLRGPFNGFLGLSELLAEEIDDMDKEEIQFAAVNMKKSASNLNNLLENLLEWSRMEQGLITVAPKENNLSHIVNECLGPLSENASKKEITIKTEIDPNLLIFADSHILQSVIRNILTNALKFTPRKGSIKIEAKEDLKDTIISISDTGIGMNANMVENLFKLDAKNNRNGTEDEASSGLGLILCEEFVEKHGGKIWVESEEGKGTTFHVSFPKKEIL